jgi:AcrR family transcriptional regulator
VPARSRTATTRDAILDAAQQVMHTLGLGNATTREIAQAAGLSEAALYKHFDDKNALFLSVLRERLPDLVAALDDLRCQVGQRSVRANLEGLAAATLGFYQQSAPFTASLFSEPDLLAQYQAHMRQEGKGPHRARGLLVEYLRAEQAAGRVSPDVDVAVAARMLMASCLERAFVNRFAGVSENAADDERFVRDVVGLLLRALGVTEASGAREVGDGGDVVQCSHDG